MKKIYYNILAFLCILSFSTGCEKFLDKSPDLGLDEDTIYESYESIRGYLDRCYPLLERWNMTGANQMSRDMNPMCITDELASSINTENFVVNTFNTGNWYSATRNSNWEIGMQGSSVISQSYKALRICNRILANIDRVQNITDEERNYILGQAHFYRAWYYYQLIKRYGGMPKLDRVFNGGDDDIPRMTYRQSHNWMMEDINQAIALLPVKWDDANYSRPDKAAAMGFKAQALLYAASPLMQNDLASTVEKPYDIDLCFEAAKAAQECLEFIRDNDTGRRFTTGTIEPGTIDAYKGIFVLPTTTFCHEEYLWWDRRNMNEEEQANTLRRYWIWADLDTFTGQDAAIVGMPTANIVAYYERKGPDGKYYPITDERSGYVEGEWSSMQNRDPRFYNNLLLPGTKWGKKGQNQRDYYISSWVGGAGYINITQDNNLSAQREFTGWLARKYTWPECQPWEYPSNKNRGYNIYRVKSFYIRVTEMYLDYAEALFEATKDATGKPEGFAWSPKEALDIIRARVGVTPIVDDYATPSTFRETYRRERTVELMFENHRWEDIRRWMIFDEVFPTSTPIKNFVWTCDQGADVDPADYNEGKDLTFSYTIVPNTVEVRNYDTRHYWYPFPGAEVGSLDNLQQNPGW